MKYCIVYCSDMDASPVPDNELTQCLDEGIRSGVFPGGVVARRLGRETTVAARGRLEYPDANADAGAVTADTVFDVASLTKIVATLPAVLLTIGAGRVGLDDEASRYLPELSKGEGRGWNGAVTIRRLLSHTSGLPAWRPYFVRLRGAAAYVAAIADELPAYAPGGAVEYSDLGFMLLGWILERAWDEPLPELAERLVFRPLGMGATGFPAAAPERFAVVAPTEIGNAHERAMALAYAEGRPVIGGRSERFPLSAAEVGALGWRTGVIRGEAHDGNCHYGLGGVSGHAGLFSAAGDIVRYLDLWAEGGPLPPALRAEAFNRQTPAGAAGRGLGWILLEGGDAWHTGFTGASIRYRPGCGDALIALTNRVHPTVRDGIGDWRQELARVAMPERERTVV